MAMIRGSERITDAQLQIIARVVWPQFRDKPIKYSKFFDALLRYAIECGLGNIFDADSAIGYWKEHCEYLEVSPDGTEFRFTEHALKQMDEWNEQDRLWKLKLNPHMDSMPLARRLIAGEPARNLRKLKDVIGTSTVTGIHDPYTTAGSLETLLKLADIGTSLSPNLRFLRPPMTKVTERTTLLSLLKDINTERKSNWEIRSYVGTAKPHRRFLVLDDGSVVTCGMSLNHIDKDEVLDRESSGSENARHDHQFFEDK